MALRSGGNSLKEALGNLVGVSEVMGGKGAQDPSARALSQGMEVSGKAGLEGLIPALQQMGSGNMLDSQIRAMQKSGEKHGYDPNLKNMIREARKYQSDAAQDARAMRKIDIKPSGGGGGGGYGGGGSSMAGGDSLAALAELLGKYEGNLAYNRSALGVGVDRNYNRAMREEGSAVSRRLGSLYSELMKQKQLETQLLEEKLRESAKANAPEPIRAGFKAGGSEFIDNPTPPLPRRRESWNTPNTPSRGERKDPYANVRDAAMQAALRYMQIQNPHLLSNL